MKFIRCFGFLTRIKSKAKRRAVMVLVSPLVLLEYMLNVPLVFLRDASYLWNVDIN